MDMDRGTDPAQRLLLELRPDPRADFVRDLETSLLAHSRRQTRFLVVAAGSGLCASFAALTLLLGVLGVLPFRIGASDRSQADSRCTTVVEVRHERRPVLVVQSDGQIRTEERVTAVRQPVKRCR
jgi:hypothetical protein